MDWSLLPDFLAIARHGSISAAAEALQVNQSTIYRRLNQLEKQLGSTLFERHHSGYRLTSEGHALFGRAEAMELEALNASRELSGHDALLQGEVRLTAPETLVEHYLVGYLHRFQQKYPDIRLTLVVDSADLNLNRREADIALRATAAPPEYLVGRKILDLHWALFAKPQLLHNHGRPVNLAGTRKLPWVGPEARLLYLAAYRWVQEFIPEQQIKMRASSLNAMAWQAEAGTGMAVLPRDMERPGLKPVLDLPQPEPVSLWLLTHPDLRNVARIKAVFDFLTDAFRRDEQQFRPLHT